MSKEYKSRHRNVAKSHLVHYVRLAATEGPVRWNWDNDAEIASIVDSIIDAAKDEIRQELAAETRQAKEAGK